MDLCRAERGVRVVEICIKTFANPNMKSSKDRFSA